MKTWIKVIAVIIIAVFLLSSGYIVLNVDEDGKKDTTAPTIDSITGDTEGTSGKIITISADFSDNINVTIATLYYKTASTNSWNDISILSGSAEIEIPSKPIEDIYYYVIIDDAAGNGPVGNPSDDGSKFYTISVSENIVELTHYAFVEEATTTWCVNCPNVADVLHELYESGDYKFYYVSMIGDKNSVADKRITNDYNVVGYPTVYIDGGYKVVVGDKEKSEFVNAITAAENRQVPKIRVTVDAEYNNETDELTTNVLVENYENETYSGQLKVYLTEKISRWPNLHKTSEGKIVPYHYGFLDFVIDEETSVDSKGETTVTDKRKLTDFAISDLYPEELTLIAVMFSSESEKEYSSPPSDGEFDAYYADAANATDLLSGGNLRPVVSIKNPVAGKLHIFGRPLFDTPFHNTVLLFRTPIIAEVQGDSIVEKVEFYIDDELISTDEEAPYEYNLIKLGLFKELIPHKHTITVTAYDDTGKTSTVDLDIIARL